MATVMQRSSSDGGSSSGWSEAGAAAAAGEEKAGWEVRPSGMVVQARDREDGAGVPPRPPPPEIRVRVKYGAARHEVAVSPIATFGQFSSSLHPFFPSSSLAALDYYCFCQDTERSDCE